MDWWPFMKKRLWALGYLSRFPPQTSLRLYAQVFETKCDRRKRISNSERATKNTTIKRRKVHFF